MAKLSELNAASAIDADDLLYVVANGQSNRATGQVAASSFMSLTGITANIASALTGAASPSASNVYLTAQVALSTKTTNTYTLSASDGAGNVVLEFTAASPITLTVPAYATVPFATGTVIGLRQGGACSLTISPASNVTINALNSSACLSGQYANGALEKTAANTWVLMGALA